MERWNSMRDKILVAVAISIIIGSVTMYNEVQANSAQNRINKQYNIKSDENRETLIRIDENVKRLIRNESR